MAMRKIRYEAVNQLVVEDKTLMGGTIPGLESSVTPQFNAYRFAVTKSHLLPDFGFYNLYPKNQKHTWIYRTQKKLKKFPP